MSGPGRRWKRGGWLRPFPWGGPLGCAAIVEMHPIPVMGSCSCYYGASSWKVGFVVYFRTVNMVFLKNVLMFPFILYP